jgi:hypothetical protein
VRRLVLAIALGIALALVIVWFWFGRLLRPGGPQPPATAATQGPGSQTVATAGTQPGTAAAAGTVADARKIRATLFYVTDDASRLVGADREVPYAEGTAAQARRLIEELLKPVEEPLAQAIPEGTTLQALFLTEKGEAFVDLSPEISSKHSGGALEELFTVYAIVDTLTVNLPAITQVQILVGGKEVDTLAGHIDLRRPLAKNLEWTRPPDATTEGATPGAAAGAAAGAPVGTSAGTPPSDSHP